MSDKGAGSDKAPVKRHVRTPEEILTDLEAELAEARKNLIKFSNDSRYVRNELKWKTQVIPNLEQKVANARTTVERKQQQRELAREKDQKKEDRKQSETDTRKRKAEEANAANAYKATLADAARRRAERATQPKASASAGPAPRKRIEEERNEDDKAGDDVSMDELSSEEEEEDDYESDSEQETSQNPMQLKRQIIDSNSGRAVGPGQLVKWSRRQLRSDVDPSIGKLRDPDNAQTAGVTDDLVADRRRLFMLQGSTTDVDTSSEVKQWLLNRYHPQQRAEWVHLPSGEIDQPYPTPHQFQFDERLQGRSFRFFDRVMHFDVIEDVADYNSLCFYGMLMQRIKRTTGAGDATKSLRFAITPKHSRVATGTSAAQTGVVFRTIRAVHPCDLTSHGFIEFHRVPMPADADEPTIRTLAQSFCDHVCDSIHNWLNVYTSPALVQPLSDRYRTKVILAEVQSPAIANWGTYVPAAQGAEQPALLATELANPWLQSLHSRGCHNTRHDIRVCLPPIFENYQKGIAKYLPQYLPEFENNTGRPSGQRTTFPYATSANKRKEAGGDASSSSVPATASELEQSWVLEMCLHTIHPFPIESIWVWSLAKFVYQCAWVLRPCVGYPEYKPDDIASAPPRKAELMTPVSADFGINAPPRCYSINHYIARYWGHSIIANDWAVVLESGYQGLFAHELAHDLGGGPSRDVGVDSDNPWLPSPAQNEANRSTYPLIAQHRIYAICPVCHRATWHYQRGQYMEKDSKSIDKQWAQKIFFCGGRDCLMVGPLNETAFAVAWSEADEMKPYKGDTDYLPPAVSCTISSHRLKLGGSDQAPNHREDFLNGLTNTLAAEAKESSLSGMDLTAEVREGIVFQCRDYLRRWLLERLVDVTTNVTSAGKVANQRLGSKEREIRAWDVLTAVGAHDQVNEFRNKHAHSHSRFFIPTEELRITRNLTPGLLAAFAKTPTRKALAEIYFHIDLLVYLGRCRYEDTTSSSEIIALSDVPNRALRMAKDHPIEGSRDQMNYMRGVMGNAAFMWNSRVGKDKRWVIEMEEYVQASAANSGAASESTAERSKKKKQTANKKAKTSGKGRGDGDGDSDSSSEHESGSGESGSDSDQSSDSDTASGSSSEEDEEEEEEKGKADDDISAAVNPLDSLADNHQVQPAVVEALNQNRVEQSHKDAEKEESESDDDRVIVRRRKPIVPTPQVSHGNDDAGDGSATDTEETAPAAPAAPKATAPKKRKVKYDGARYNELTKIIQSTSGPAAAGGASGASGAPGQLGVRTRTAQGTRTVENIDYAESVEQVKGQLQAQEDLPADQEPLVLISDGLQIMSENSKRTMDHPNSRVAVRAEMPVADALAVHAQQSSVAHDAALVTKKIEQMPDSDRKALFENEAGCEKVLSFISADLASVTLAGAPRLIKAIVKQDVKLPTNTHDIAAVSMDDDDERTCAVDDCEMPLTPGCNNNRCEDHCIFLQRTSVDGKHVCAVHSTGHKRCIVTTCTQPPSEHCKRNACSFEHCHMLANGLPCEQHVVCVHPGCTRPARLECSGRMCYGHFCGVSNCPVNHHEQPRHQPSSGAHPVIDRLSAAELVPAPASSASSVAALPFSASSSSSIAQPIANAHCALPSCANYQLENCQHNACGPDHCELVRGPMGVPCRLHRSALMCQTYFQCDNYADPGCTHRACDASHCMSLATAGSVCALPAHARSSDMCAKSHCSEPKMANCSSNQCFSHPCADRKCPHRADLNNEWKELDDPALKQLTKFPVNRASGDKARILAALCAAVKAKEDLGRDFTNGRKDPHALKRLNEVLADPVKYKDRDAAAAHFCSNLATDSVSRFFVSLGLSDSRSSLPVAVGRALGTERTIGTRGYTKDGYVSLSPYAAISQYYEPAPILKDTGNVGSVETLAMEFSMTKHKFNAVMRYATAVCAETTSITLGFPVLLNIWAGRRAGIQLPLDRIPSWLPDQGGIVTAQTEYTERFMEEFIRNPLVHLSVLDPARLTMPDELAVDRARQRWQARTQEASLAPWLTAHNTLSREWLPDQSGTYWFPAPEGMGYTAHHKQKRPTADQNNSRKLAQQAAEGKNARSRDTIEAATDLVKPADKSAKSKISGLLSKLTLDNLQAADAKVPDKVSITIGDKTFKVKKPTVFEQLEAAQAEMSAAYSASVAAQTKAHRKKMQRRDDKQFRQKTVKKVQTHAPNDSLVNADGEAPFDRDAAALLFPKPQNEGYRNGISPELKQYLETAFRLFREDGYVTAYKQSDVARTIRTYMLNEARVTERFMHRMHVETYLTVYTFATSRTLPPDDADIWGMLELGGRTIAEYKDNLRSGLFTNTKEKLDVFFNRIRDTPELSDYLQLMILGGCALARLVRKADLTQDQDLSESRTLVLLTLCSHLKTDKYDAQHVVEVPDGKGNVVPTGAYIQDSTTLDEKVTAAFKACWRNPTPEIARVSSIDEVAVAFQEVEIRETLASHFTLLVDAVSNYIDAAAAKATNGNAAVKKEYAFAQGFGKYLYKREQVQAFISYVFYEDALASEYQHDDHIKPSTRMLAALAWMCFRSTFTYLVEQLHLYTLDLSRRNNTAPPAQWLHAEKKPTELVSKLVQYTERDMEHNLRDFVRQGRRILPELLPAASAAQHFERPREPKRPRNDEKLIPHYFTPHQLAVLYYEHTDLREAEESFYMFQYRVNKSEASRTAFTVHLDRSLFPYRRVRKAEEKAEAKAKQNVATFVIPVPRAEVDAAVPANLLSSLDTRILHARAIYHGQRRPTDTVSTDWFRIGPSHMSRVAVPSFAASSQPIVGMSYRPDLDARPAKPTERPVLIKQRSDVINLDDSDDDKLDEKHNAQPQADTQTERDVLLAIEESRKSEAARVLKQQQGASESAAAGMSRAAPKNNRAEEEKKKKDVDEAAWEQIKIESEQLKQKQKQNLLDALLAKQSAAPVKAEQPAPAAASRTVEQEAQRQRMDAGRANRDAILAAGPAQVKAERGPRPPVSRPSAPANVISLDSDSDDEKMPPLSPWPRAAKKEEDHSAAAALSRALPLPLPLPLPSQPPINAGYFKNVYMAPALAPEPGAAPAPVPIKKGYFKNVYMAPAPAPVSNNAGYAGAMFGAPVPDALPMMPGVQQQPPPPTSVQARKNSAARAKVNHVPGAFAKREQ